MTMFNFFVVLSGLVTAGLGTTLQGPSRLAILGIFLGLLLMLLSFVFWKVDQRAAFLVKHAEVACIEIERHLLPPAAQLFASEQASFHHATVGKAIRGPWTFGRSLRVAFAGMALVGAAATVMGGLRVAGVVGWEPATVAQPAAAPSPAPAPGAPPRAPRGDTVRKI